MQHKPFRAMWEMGLNPVLGGNACATTTFPLLSLVFLVPVYRFRCGFDDGLPRSPYVACHTTGNVEKGLVLLAPCLESLLLHGLIQRSLCVPWLPELLSVEKHSTRKVSMISQNSCYGGCDTRRGGL